MTITTSGFIVKRLIQYTSKKPITKNLLMFLIPGYVVHQWFSTTVPGHSSVPQVTSKCAARL
jgi:hypothetical protein